MSEVARLHELLATARSLIDPEAHPDWDAEVQEKLTPCDQLFDECDTLRREVDEAQAQVAALTQERDAANETIAAQDRAAREWAQRTATLAAANEALRCALRAIADAALLDQWSAIELLGPALGVPVSQLPSREAFGKVARTALGAGG